MKDVDYKYFTTYILFMKTSSNYEYHLRSPTIILDTDDCFPALQSRNILEVEPSWRGLDTFEPRKVDEVCPIIDAEGLKYFVFPWFLNGMVLSP